jgi:hypothetical protein
VRQGFGKVLHLWSTLLHKDADLGAAGGGSDTCGLKDVRHEFGRVHAAQCDAGLVQSVATRIRGINSSCKAANPV